MKKNILFSILKFLFLFTVLLSSVNVFAIIGEVDYSNSKNIGSGYSGVSMISLFTYSGKNDGINGSNGTAQTVVTPVFSPATGSFATGQSLTVTITTTTGSSKIYYTTDGSTPTTSKTLYSGAITVTATTTIKAIATKNGWNNSSIATATFTATAPAATPTFSPTPGNFTTTQNVTLSCATSGATIHYTTDGSTPDISSPIYSSSIPVSVPTTINAIAMKSGVPNSNIAVGTYNVLLPASAPSFSVGTGTYNTTQYVTITSSTVGASIYYTKDGTDPTTSSSLYSSAVAIDVNQTLKAIAVKSQLSNSTITSAGYIIKCANPTFSPVAGTYSTFQTVSLNSLTSGASIRYTTDGNDPSSTNGTIYTAPFNVNATLLVKAIAYKAGTTNSDISNGNYNLQLVKVSSPVLSVVQGTYNTFQTIGITSPTTGSTIMFTTNGTDASPTNGTAYTTPIAVNASTVIKTMAFKYGMANSDLITGSYVIQLLPADAPVFDPQAGAYEDQLTVSIGTTTSGCTIHYTTDGSTPTETDGAEYTAPVTINTNTNFRAIAFKHGMNDSQVSESNCIIKVAKPQFSPVPGNYNTFQSVTLSTTTSGATIRYTTNGSTPSHTNGTVYSGAIAVNASTTIKAIAYLTGKTDSDIATGIYNITLLKVATPTFSPVSGTYNTYQSVALSSTTSGATIKYTTDGSAPSQVNGTVYSTAIPIQSTTTLKAIAYKVGMTDSDVGSSIYTIQLLTVATPTFSVAAGTYGATQSVSITSTTSGALVYYTTDGSTPTTSSTLYSGAVSVTANATLNAIAVKSGMNNSLTASTVYVINCAIPVLTPATGTYNSVQTVSMSTTTSGAIIYYTTDGTTTPTAASAQYSIPITVGSNITLKAVAIKTGMGNSTVASETYTILLPVTAPTFSPVAGTYNTPQTVIIASSTSGASIRYSTDGSTPSDVTGTAYTAPITISTNTPLKAVAYKTGMSNSTVTSDNYVINCATPILTPATGTYTSVQSVTITSATSGASIYYTIDGTIPTTASLPYSSAISVGANKTIKAIAIKTGMGNSGVGSEIYTILLPCAAPTFTAAAGTYTSVQSVIIASTTTGADIYYTLDGNDPTTSSPHYTGPVLVGSTLTLKAIAVLSGMSNSPITSGLYTILLPAAAPQFSPVAGTYSTTQSVAITSTTTGGDTKIYYTTNGTDPTTSSTLYSAPVSIAANSTLKAITVKTGMSNSPVSSAVYIIKCATPQFSPSPGSYNTFQNITLSSATSGATIKYTTNGSQPSPTNGTVYTSIIAVNATTTIKAIAYQTGMTDSDIASGIYTIQLLDGSAPTFSPAGGTFDTPQNVTMTSTTTGGDASIYYTTDGNDPTISSTKYSGPVSVAANTTLKAFLVKTGMANSIVTSGNYVIKCAVPQFSPTPGNYTTFQSVTLTSATSGATIKYTIDGSQPSQSNGTTYTGAIVVNSTTTINAIAFKTGMADSDIGTGTYTITLIKVATPTFFPAAGTFNTFQSIALSCSTTGATIKYTTDGSNPSQTNGTVYTTAIPIQQTTTLKVIAYKVEMTDSDVASATYTIQLLDVAAPTFSPVGGTYDTPQSVSIASATSGASVYYTTDGSTPSVSSTLYSGTPISVSANATLKAIAIKAQMNNSTTSTSSYVINCATPVLTPTGGTYISVQNVSMTTATAGASIYYTTDGSTPSISSTLYTPGSTITVGANVTLKAIAIKTNMGNSGVASQDYVILIPVTAPFFTPPAGTFNSTQSVTINSAVEGASIRYTTDGTTTPSETVGTVYTVPVSISANTTLKAIAYKSGMTNSPVTSGDYVINCAAPVLSVPTGSYNVAQSVTISSATTGALIYYTINGDTPSASSTLYNGTISVGSNMTIKAIAVKSGMGNSGISSEAYTIVLPVAAPTFTPAPGSYTSVQPVTIASATSGADIYYTLEGSTPTISSPHYDAPVSVASNLTLKAIAVKTGMNISPVTSGDYVILLPAAAPQFSPIGGSYTAAQNVTITSTTTGVNAKIYYTTDGSDPTPSSTLYAVPVSVNADLTLKAITVNTGMSNSPVTSAAYVIYPKASDPTFLPAAGTYIGSQNISMATTSVGAKIHYTTDGTAPSETVGTEYTSPVTIAVNTTFKAIAYGATFAKSNVTSVVYNIKVATPVLSLLAGNYNLQQTLTISCSTAGANIYYTTDGTVPSVINGTLYTTEIAIGLNTTNIQAIAIKAGMADSDPVSATYVVNLGKVVTPVFTEPSGTFVGDQLVTIATETAGATIKYTLDGTPPGATNGTVYTTPVSITASGTLKAYATKTNMIDSDIASGDYKIKPATVTFTPLPGNYTAVQSVIIASVTPGVTIKYTLDGATPTKTIGTVYTTAIELSSNKTLKAFAFKPGMEDGDIVSGDYTFQLTRVVKPVFTPAPGNFTTPQSVTLSTLTAGATIRYTIDGTAPSKTVGRVYAGPITISVNTTINAIAYKTGLDDSEVVSGDYVIVLGSSDYDGDGVTDNEDDYAVDPKLAFNNYYPGVGFGSVAFEDNWPSKGDYDMNDMVVDYRFNQITNSENMVVQLDAKFVVRAMGASFHNGFGIELPVSPAQVTSCVVKLKNGNPVPMGSLVTIDPATGLEASQAKAVVILFDDGFNVLVPKYAGIGVNTTPGVPFVVPDTLLMTIMFTQPVSPDVLKSQIFNPFIFTNRTRGNEVHLPDFPPTSLATMSLFNTFDDKSAPATGKYYKSANNLPWALNIYEGYQYPNEKVSILDAFKHFAEWAGSAGVLFPDWYKDLSGYRNASSIYTQQ